MSVIENDAEKKYLNQIEENERFYMQNEDFYSQYIYSMEKYKEQNEMDDMLHEEFMLKEFYDHEKSMEKSERFGMHCEEIYSQRLKDREEDLRKYQLFLEDSEKFDMEVEDKYLYIKKSNIVYELNCLLNIYFKKIMNNHR